jgi:hypothetical protein
MGAKYMGLPERDMHATSFASCTSSKEPYVPFKESCIPTKEAYMLSKERCMPLYTRPTCYQKRHACHLM